MLRNKVLKLLWHLSSYSIPKLELALLIFSRNIIYQGIFRIIQNNEKSTKKLKIDIKQPT